MMSANEIDQDPSEIFRGEPSATQIELSAATQNDAMEWEQYVLQHPQSRLYYKALRKLRWRKAFHGPSPGSYYEPNVGEVVRIKSRRELLATLDGRGFLRGLELTPDMLRYAGKEFRVLSRIDRFIESETGRMKVLKRVCVALEGVTCSGKCDFCPRQMHHFWRSVWLEPPTSRTSR